MARRVFSLTIELPDDLAAELEQLVEETGREASCLAQRAFVDFLEDSADYRHAVTILERERDRPSLTLEEAKRELGLEA